MARKSRKTLRTENRQPQSEILYHTAIYARLSIEDNGIQGDSIENQIEMIEKYISGCQDLEVVHTFVDNGETGTNFERPAFSDMMEAVKNGSINCIVVKDDCVIKARTPQTLENRHFLRIGTEFRAIQRPQRAAYHIETS